MVSHDSLVRAEKRLGVPAVIGRFHKAPRQLQDDYELDEKVGWNHGGLRIFVHTYPTHTDEIHLFLWDREGTILPDWFSWMSCSAISAAVGGALWYK